MRVKQVNKIDEAENAWIEDTFNGNADSQQTSPPYIHRSSISVFIYARKTSENKPHRLSS